jgi:hypothetical protein
VTVTVLGAGGAVITSPVSASGTAGTPFTSQIVATNGPITNYSATGLPTGLTVNALTGAITGTPTVAGTFNATLTATNAVGVGPSLVVPFTIGTPVTAGSPVTMTVPLNTPTTVDFVSSIAGLSITGVAVATSPRIGTATVNGTQITYTPRTNYFGPDSFTYTAFGAGGTSAPATVTVNVVGRPDPSQDASVIGTINSMVDTARRFSQSQLTNYQRRMESLHRGGGGTTGGATRGSNAQASTGTAPAAPVNAAATPRPFPDLTSANPLGDPQNTARLTLPVRVAGLAPPTDAVNPATGTFGTMVPGLISTLASAATSRSVNLASIGGGSDIPGAAEGAISFWAGGDARFGTRDPTGSAGSTSFSTDGISIGADRRFSDAPMA